MTNLGLGGGQRWTINDLTAYGKAQQQAQQQKLQQGGFDALFAGAKPVQDMGSMNDLLYSGNQFFNPFGSATSYSADQVRAMQNSMPMSIGEGSRVLYKGQVYDNPLGGNMQTWNAMTPQQKNQMVSGIQGAGAGTWREQDYMAGGGTPVPSFDQLGANTGAAQTPTGYGLNPPQSPQQMPQQSPQQGLSFQDAARQAMSSTGPREPGGPFPQAGPQAPQMGMQFAPQQQQQYMPQFPMYGGLGLGGMGGYGMGGGMGGLFGYGGMVPSGFGGYGSQVVRYF